MNLFFGKILLNQVILEAQEAQHCTKVLRKRVGDEVFVTNGEGATVRGKIVEITTKQVIIEDIEEHILPSITTGLHLAVSPTKNIDRFEFLIEKAVELGVEELTPVYTFHTERKHLNIEKLQKKALAACKQSLRSSFMKLNPMQKLPDFISQHLKEKIYVAHCNRGFTRKKVTDITFASKPIILIGPEGDFSEQEIIQLQENKNTISISLGNNRLRTETAAVLCANYCYLQFM